MPSFSFEGSYVQRGGAYSAILGQVVAAAAGQDADPGVLGGGQGAVCVPKAPWWLLAGLAWRRGQGSVLGAGEGTIWSTQGAVDCGFFGDLFKVLCSRCCCRRLLCDSAWALL